MKTFKQALKPKNGWAHADDESMCANLATMIASHACLNEKVVYAWIRKHYKTDWQIVKNYQGKSEPYFLGLVGSILADEKYQED